MSFAFTNPASRKIAITVAIVQGLSIAVISPDPVAVCRRRQQAAIDKLASVRFDEHLALRDVWLLRLRAWLAGFQVMDDVDTLHVLQSGAPVVLTPSTTAVRRSAPPAPADRPIAMSVWE